MTETLMSVGKANQTISSRQVAEATGKEHKNVMRDIRDLIEKGAIDCIPQVSSNLSSPNEEPIALEHNYTDVQNKPRPEYLLNEYAANVLASSYDPVIARKLIKLVRELKKSIENKPLDFSDPATVLQLAQNWAESETKRKLAESKVLALEQINNDNKPKVLFADAVETSKSSILIGELAKILKQNGVEIGQNRLFEWLREKGYLISRKGTDYNMPTQKAMDLGLFDIKETAITHSDGHVSVNKTTKVKGKGQTYFINKFLKK